MASCPNRYFRSMAINSTLPYQTILAGPLSRTLNPNSLWRIALMVSQASMQCRLSRRCLSAKVCLLTRWATSSIPIHQLLTLRARYSSRIPSWRCRIPCKTHRARRASICLTWRGSKSAKRHYWDLKDTPSTRMKIRHLIQIVCKKHLCTTHSKPMCKWTS